jgi:hypothetical protein
LGRRHPAPGLSPFARMSASGQTTFPSFIFRLTKLARLRPRFQAA